MISGFVKKLVHQFNRLSHVVRYSNWNKRPGVSISKLTFIASSAKIQFAPDGLPLGGSLTIADGVRISDGAILAPYGGSISLGENVYIGPYCVLYGHGGLSIAANTLVAAHCVLVPTNHTFDDVDTTINSQSSTNLGISIGEDVWVGAGVKILDGVSIGKGCVVGAGAVVTRSLPEHSIAVGVPARVKGHRGKS